MINLGYRLNYNGKEDGRRGIGFILSPKFACLVSGVQQKNEHIINIDLKLEQEKRYTGICPTSGKIHRRERLILCPFAIICK